MAQAKQLAYDSIKESIITCKLRPGEVISETALMEELGVGRTPVREALLLLEHEGYVKIFPKRGIFVNEISLQSINDTYEMLLILEPIAAVDAMKNLDKEILEYYLNLFTSSDLTYYQQNYIKVDREFHEKINSASNNKYMYETLMKMYDYNTRVRLSKFVNQSRMFETRLEHTEILRAMLEKDEEKVRQLMVNHIHNGRRAALS